MPGGGLISDRSHTLGPKMKRELLGWLRPVRARKADKMARLRPSCRPTTRSLSRRSASELRSSRKGDTTGEMLAIFLHVPAPKNLPAGFTTDPGPLYRANDATKRQTMDMSPS